MPPQGLLVIAAYLPEHWQVRFVDENLRRATKEDFEWAEAVFVSGMHIQRQQMNDICRRAHDFDLPVAIGGPSVSACPDYYPAFDYLHVGELGDATDDLIARLARDTSRPPEQVVLKTKDRVDMSDFPVPAYELAEMRKYMLGSIQYSSGCPYQCEFCDIPGLYGRNPRLKTPAADHRRTRQAARMRRHRLGLFRRRQFHRQPQGRARSAAASDRMAEANRLRDAAGLRGDAQHRQASRNPREDARGVLRHHLLRHRDARSRGAEGDAQGPQHDGPDPGGRADHQFLRHGSRLRHHHGARHRQAWHGGCAVVVHRSVEDSAADHQPAAGAAEDAVVGPAGTREPAGP